MKTVKVGMMPGRLVEVAVEDVTTVAQAFELAGVAVQEGFEIRMDGEITNMDARITGNLVVASKKIKGNATVKVGVMPGRLVELALEGNETVAQAFELAGIEVPSGYEIRVDGEKVNTGDKVTGNLIVASKMIKGNRNVKVGVMPGRLVELALEGNETVEEAFRIAGIEIPSGYEIRIDGEKAVLNDKINGNLIVASKMIKGNSQTTKVGLMPGRLIEIVAEEGMSVAQKFELAGVEIPSGYEVRGDGEKVELNDTKSYNLLVASKMIKGNK